MNKIKVVFNSKYLLRLDLNSSEMPHTHLSDNRLPSVLFYHGAQQLGQLLLLTNVSFRFG